MGRRVYASLLEAEIARRAQNRAWHRPFSASVLPWRVVADGEIVACFQHERDARGFAKARYGADAEVERRTPGRKTRRKDLEAL